MSKYNINYIVFACVLDMFSSSPIWSQNVTSSVFISGLKERLKYTMLSSRAQSTTAGYNRSFQKWKNFATHILQVPYLPAYPFHIALYLQHLAETSSIAAINSTFYSINWAHGLGGIPSPTHNIFLVTVRESIIRRFSQGHTSRKEPLDIAHLKTLGTKIGLNDLLQLRSYVMFVRISS